MASAPLVPCSGCRRHIRIDHETCPFCRAAVPAGFEKRVVPSPNRRLDRLATFTFAATLAVSACGEVESDEQQDRGIAAQDAGGKDGDKDVGNPVPAYGLSPPPDASRKDGAIWDEDGGLQAAYGAPPPDGGWEDVPVAPPYGLPPLDGGQD